MAGDAQEAPLNSVQNCCAFASEHIRGVNQLYTSAKIDLNTNRGLEVQEFVKLFETGGPLADHPELFNRVCSVATATTLFGQTRGESIDAEQFDKMRREFLVDLLRGAISSDYITQGREPLCTATSALKLVSPSEYLRLGTDLALHGRATTASGAEMRLHEGFFDRAQRNANNLSQRVFCGQPSAGSLMVLYSVMQLGDEQVNPAVPIIERQRGLYWHQYARAVENLTGQRHACAAANANDIPCDQASNAAGRAAGAQGIHMSSTPEYVEAQLRAGKPVFIHTYFNAASRENSVGRAHSEHAMVAEAVVRADGRIIKDDSQLWVRCSNPTGDLFKTERDAQGRPIEFAAGSKLGDPAGYWFIAGENGDIFVRQDVFNEHLYSVLVEYDEKYIHQPGDKVQLLGTLVEAERLHQFYVPIVPPTEVSEEEHEDRRQEKESEVPTGTFKPAPTETDDRKGRYQHGSEDQQFVASPAVNLKRKEEEAAQAALVAEIAMREKSSKEEQEARESAASRTGFADMGRNYPSSSTTRALMYGVDGGASVVVPPQTFTSKGPVSQQPTTPAPEAPRPSASSQQAEGPSPRLKALFGGGA
jgi:hypothetical protein